jgi:ABC-type thiamin/hydroxymethylpyrimidine transport system permease subunit
MKTLKNIVVLVLLSLLIFYVGAVLITATFDLSKMDGEIRGIIFGIWMGVVVIGSLCLGANEAAD